MGDIIKSFVSRSGASEKPCSLRFYFDTGSPRTFVKLSVALKMKGVAKLPQPEIFSGLGNGSFTATYMLRLQVKLSDLWVPHLCYVVSDEVLDPNYDVLLGHDFMQIYDIQVNPVRKGRFFSNGVKPKQKEVIIKKEALKMALKVRPVTSYPVTKLPCYSVTMLLLLYTLHFTHYTSSLHAEVDFIPLANVSVLGGQYYFEKDAASFGGNVYLEFAPTLQFTDELSLIPTYSATYRGTKNVTELVGGGTLSQQAQDHLISLRLTNQMSEDFKLKLNTSYKLELLKETKDESWGNGLFDYYKIAAGVEGEKKFYPQKRGVESLTGGYTFYPVKFNNYSSLAEKTTSYGQELSGKIGKNILDFNAHEIYLNSEFVFSPNIKGKADYSFTYKDFSEQKVINDGPTYTNDKRNDLIHWLSFSVYHFHEPKKRLKFVGLLGMDIISYQSNQNHYDAKETKFIPKYYNYLELTIKPGVSVQFGKKGQVVDFSYEYAYRSYPERLVQNSSGQYLTDKINTNTSTVSLGTTCPLKKKINLRLQADYLVSSSNMKYEKVYRYNYDTANYFLGVSWEY